MKALRMVSFILFIVGTANWGIVGRLNYNLAESLLGGVGLANITYILVCLSGVVLLMQHRGDYEACSF